MLCHSGMTNQNGVSKTKLRGEIKVIFRSMQSSPVHLVTIMPQPLEFSSFISLWLLLLDFLMLVLLSFTGNY